MTDDRAAAYFERGRQDLEAGDWAAAVAALSDAVRLDPTLAEAFHHRAGAHLAGWHLDAALADATAAIHLDPGRPNFWLTRANVHYHRRDVPAAWVDYHAAYRLDPAGNARDVVAILEREAATRLTASLKDCANHLRFDPGDFHSLAKRAVLFTLLGREAEAAGDVAEYGNRNAAGVDQLRHYLATARERARASGPPTAS